MSPEQELSALQLELKAIQKERKFYDSLSSNEPDTYKVYSDLTDRAIYIIKTTLVLERKYHPMFVFPERYDDRGFLRDQTSSQEGAALQQTASVSRTVFSNRKNGPVTHSQELHLAHGLV